MIVYYHFYVDYRLEKFYRSKEVRFIANLFILITLLCKVQFLKWRGNRVSLTASYFQVFMNGNF